MKGLTILEWKDEDRPREKFINYGASCLTNAELMAILLGSGSRNENVVDLSRRILADADNSLSTLRKYSMADLQKFKGIGKSKALTILALFELFRRMESEKMPKRAVIYSSKEAAEIMQPVLKDKSREECWVLYLNVGNRLISKECVTSGGISSTIIDMRLIIKRAFEQLATSIILVHNHPSGNVNPSAQDSVQTNRLKDAVKCCDIKLLDHIIVAGDDYFSYADEGLI